jgi:hypothetical protein
VEKQKRAISKFYPAKNKTRYEQEKTFECFVFLALSAIKVYFALTASGRMAIPHPFRRSKSWHSEEPA